MTNEEKLTDEDFKRMFESMPIVSMKVFEELKREMDDYYINNKYIKNKYYERKKKEQQFDFN